MTTTTQTNSATRLVPVPATPESSFTSTPADSNAETVIARVFAAHLEQEAIKAGSHEFSVELLEWSEATLGAQVETLPEQ